jgi:hypothetical protein
MKTYRDWLMNGTACRSVQFLELPLFIYWWIKRPQAD